MDPTDSPSGSPTTTPHTYSPTPNPTTSVPTMFPTSMPNEASMEVTVIFFFVVSAIILGGATWWVIHRYAVPTIRPMVRVCVWLGWYYCYGFAFLIPGDITIMFMGENGRALASALVVIWEIGYWINFVWSWFLLPFLQEYYEAGEFHFCGRFKRSLWNNTVLYVVCGVLGIIILAITYFASDRVRSADSMQGYVMCLSHLAGSSVAMLLLGYGLVAIPRGLWRRANRGAMKSYYETEVSKIASSHTDAKYQVVQMFDLYQKVKGKVKASDNRSLDIFLERIDHYILLNSDPSIRAEEIHNYSSFLALELSKKLAVIRDKPGDEIKESDLAKVNYAVKRSLAVFRLHSENLKSTLRSAVRLNQALAMQSQEKQHLAPKWSEGIWKGLYYRYSVHAERKLLRVGAVFTGLLSTLILWSEITLWAPINLSLFGVMIHAAKHTPVILQFVCLLPWLYICWCAFSAVFEMKIFELYNMSSNRASSETSMLLNCYYTTRFIGPLAYNFLKCSRIDNTTFQIQQGDMTVVPFFGSTFNDLFPILLLLFFIATVFNVFGKCLAFFRISKNQAQQEAADKVNRMEGVRMIEEASKNWKESDMKSLKTIDLTPLE